MSVVLTSRWALLEVCSSVGRDDWDIDEESVTAYVDSREVGRAPFGNEIRI